MPKQTQVLVAAFAAMIASGCALVPARVAQVRSVSPPLELLGQATHVDCADPLRSDTCTFSTETTIHNPSNAPVHATMELSGFRVSATQVEIGGAADAPIEAQYPDTERPLTVGPNATETVRIRGEVQNGVGLVHFESPLHVRHRLLAPESSRELDFTLPLARSARASDFTCVIGIETPGGQPAELRREPAIDLSAAAGAPRPPRPASPPLTIAEACAQPEVQVHVPAARANVSGGPLVAAMIVTSPSTGRLDRFAARAGWEWGLQEWLLASANLESDFRESVTLVPMIEVASTGVRIPDENGNESEVGVPSFSVGAGVPIRVGTETSAGGRIDAGVAFPFVRVFVFAEVRFGAAVTGAAGTGLAFSL